MEDLGWCVGLKVWTDSSAAKAVGSRRGLGKLRHIELKYLWVQELVRDGRVRLGKVKGEENVADHLTKGRALWEIRGMLAGVGAFVRASEGMRDEEVGGVWGRRVEKTWERVRGMEEGRGEGVHRRPTRNEEQAGGLREGLEQRQSWSSWT